MDYNCRSWIIYNVYFELELYICVMLLLELFHSYDNCLLVCVSAVCLRNLHSTVLQTALSGGAFLPYTDFTLETGGTAAGSKPIMDNSMQH